MGHPTPALGCLISVQVRVFPIQKHSPSGKTSFLSPASRQGFLLKPLSAGPKQVYGLPGLQKA